VRYVSTAFSDAFVRFSSRVWCNPVKSFCRDICNARLCVFFQFL
jgi:hypothetical protein